jgi:hypothetical protein
LAALVHARGEPYELIAHAVGPTKLGVGSLPFFEKLGRPLTVRARSYATGVLT